MADSINDGLGGVDKRILELTRLAQRGELSMSNMQKTLQDMGMDANAVVVAIGKAFKTMQSGRGHITYLAEQAKQVTEESDNWINNFRESSKAAGKLGGSVGSTATDAKILTSAFQRMATAVGGVSDAQESHNKQIDRTLAVLQANVKVNNVFGKGLQAIEKQEKAILAEIRDQESKNEKIVIVKGSLLEIQGKIADLNKEEAKQVADMTGAFQKQLDTERATLKALQESNASEQAIAVAAEKVAESERGIDAMTQSIVGTREADKKLLLASLDAEVEKLEALMSEANITKEQSDSYVKQLESLKSQRKILDDMAEASKEMRGDFTGTFSSAMGLFKGMTKASPKDLKDRQDKFKQIQETGKAMGGAKGAVIGAVGGVGEMISSIMMKLNLPMLIASAVISAFDMAIEFVYKNDALVKKFNNVFNEVTAPVTDGRAFARSAKVFADNLNKAVGDTGASLNYELGVTADEWSSMFKSMASRGISGQAMMGEDLGKQVPIMKAVRASSLLMGKSLDEMGSDMAEWSAQFKSPFDSMKESMDRIGFAAKRAGLTGKFFLDVVNQSTLGLATYGKFIDVAVNALEKFNKSGLMSQKTAAAAAQQYTEFLSGDFSQNMKVLGMADAQGANTTEEWKASMEDRNKRLATAPAGSDEWKKLRGEIAVMSGILKLDVGARNAAMAQNAKYMTDRTGKILEKFIANFNSSGSKSIAEISYLLKDQLPRDLVDALQVYAENTSKNLKDLAGVVKSGGAEAEAIKAFLASAATRKMVESDDKLGMVQAIKGLGISDTYKSILTDAVGSKAVMTKLIATGGIVQEADVPTLSVQAATESQSGAGKVLEKAVGQGAQIDAITELQKRMGITKDTASYIIASSNSMQTATSFLGKIMETLNKFLSYFLLFNHKDEKALAYDANIKSKKDQVENSSAGLREYLVQKRLASDPKLKRADLEKEDLSPGTKANMLGGIDNELRAIEYNSTRKQVLKENPGATRDAIDRIMKGILDYSGQYGTVDGESYDDNYKLMPLQDLPENAEGATTKKATGGIVPGSSLSGDHVPAMLNSREMVLNTAQQSNLFRMLDVGNTIGPQGGGGNGSQSPVRVANITVNVNGAVTGEDVVVAIKKHWANAKYWEGTKAGYGTA